MDLTPLGNAGGTAVLSVRVDLGTLGGRNSYAAGINNQGVVVGWSGTTGGATHAFRWSAASGMVDLGTLPGDAASQAVAVLNGSTEEGWQILGVSGSDGRWTPVVWSASGAIATLPVSVRPTIGFGFPEGFNERGEIVGWDSDAPLQRGWIWSAKQGKQDLTSSVEGGSIEGAATAITGSGLALLTTRGATCQLNPQCWRTYLWSQTNGYRALETPAGNPEANVTGLALNDLGTVVGWTTPDPRGVGALPYRWTASTGFELLPGYSASAYGYATAVNSAGTIVGSALDPSSGSIVASVWPASGGIAMLSPGDANPSVAVAINSSGMIAGWAAIVGGVNHAVIWKPGNPATTSLGAALDRTSDGAITGRALVSAASTPCLSSVSSIQSRQKLFACVLAADRVR